MPAVHFEVTWPDGEQSSYYSPSTVIKEFFEQNTPYTQQEFSQRVFNALDEASERVRAKYGFACSAAADEARKIKLKLEALKQTEADGLVIFKQFS